MYDLQNHRQHSRRLNQYKPVPMSALAPSPVNVKSPLPRNNCGDPSGLIPLIKVYSSYSLGCSCSIELKYNLCN